MEMLELMKRISSSNGRSVLVACMAVTGAAAILLARCTSAEQRDARAQGTQGGASEKAQSQELVTAPRAATAPPPFDPMAGEYPQIMWMANLMEVRGPVKIDERGELVIDTTGGKQSPTSRVLTGDEERRFFESARLVPGWRHVASPVVMSRPGTTAEIAIGSRDKPGHASNDVGMRVNGRVADRDTISNVAVIWSDGRGMTITQEHDGVTIPERAGLVMVGPIGEPNAAGQHERWSVALVRPTILRSIDDYPFQRASALPASR